MNHQINPNGQSPRVADYFVIVGTTDDLIPLAQQSEHSHAGGAKRLSMQFEPSITDQYPLTERRGSPFPSGLPLFCFPDALEIYTESKSPSFFSFVQTSESGAHILGCCLVLYEPITAAARESLVNIYGARGDTENMETARTARLVVPKCLCITSTWPFIDNFRKILCQLYRISLSPSVMPLERYICNFLDDVPAPPPGRVAINYYMGDLAVSFQCPPANRPHVWNSFPVDPLFECLNLSNVLLVMSAILAERQIIFVSTQLSLLTTCAEVLTSLMYPLRWSHVYIPILPRALLGVFGAPVPFIVGIHSDFLKSVHCSIPDEAVVVFIDDNRVELGALGLPPALPESRGRKLQAALTPLVSATFDRRLTPWKSVRLSHFDSAFNMSIRPDRANGTMEQGKSNIDEIALREAFLKFFVAIMKNYRKYLIYPSHETPNPLINFQQKDFIEDHPADWVDFLKSVLPTQAFCQFCDARISSSSLKDADIRFFDESIEAKHNRYTFRFFSVDTPFLNDQTNKHVKTVVAPAPSLEGLPGYSPQDMDSELWVASASGKVVRSASLASHEGSTDSHSSNTSGARGISNLLGIGKSNRKSTTDDPNVEMSEKNSQLSIQSDSALQEAMLEAAAEANKKGYKKSKEQEPVTYIYDNFPRLRSDLFALPREGLNAPPESPYHQHTKKELRELKENPFTAAPLKSNDAVADLFASRLKRIPHYKHKFQGLTEGMSGMFSGGNSATRTRAGSTGSSWFKSKNNVVALQRNFARRGSGAVDSSFSETASEENANACTHNAFLTLLCFVISKNKSLPAVRRAPPATTKLINEYGKGLSDAVRGSTISYSGLGEDDNSGPLRRTYSASISTNSLVRNSLLRRSHSSIPADEKMSSSFSDLIPGRGTEGGDSGRLSGCGSVESLDVSGIVLPPSTGLYSSSLNNIQDADTTAVDYDSEESDHSTVRAFKHISDNIREETLVASKAGLKMAFEVLYVMTDKGLPPDELTYRSLAECCAVCGDGHCAIDLLEDMMYWGYLPDPDITSSVVQAMLHSSARDVGCSSDAGESGGAASAERRYGPRFLTARDVLDAVNTNQLHALRERLEARVDDDVHTYASKLVSRRAQVKSEPISHQRKPELCTTSNAIVAKQPGAVESSDSTSNGLSHSASAPVIEKMSVKLEKGEVSPAVTVMKLSSGSGANTPTQGGRPKEMFLETHAVPTSLRLATHLLLADRILDMQFPDLEINLNDPFGTFCPNPKCGKSHTMAQLREGWDGVDPNKYTTKCVHCSREFVPRFTVHSSCSNWLVDEIDLLSDDLPFDYGKGSDTPLWCELLSPWVLRKELLMILLNDGIDRVLSADFRKPSPSNMQNSVIFWNMVVAFRGCGLPYQFMISETLSTAFLVPLGDPM